MKILGTLLLVAILWSPLSATEKFGDLEFHTNFDSLMQASHDNDQTVVIKFYTDWCKWCKVMADSTLPDPYVQLYLKNFALAHINAEVDTNTANRYGVKSYPTTLILNRQGVEIDRLVGYYPPEEFVAGVTNALAGIGTLEDLLRKSEAQPEIDNIFEVGQKYRWRGEYDQAANYFNKVMAMDPTNEKGKSAESAYNLGHMKYKLKDYLSAVELWKKMVAAYPANEISIDAELMTAYSYQKAGDFKNAQKEFKAFLKKYPDTEEKEWIEEQFTAMKSKK